MFQQEALEINKWLDFVSELENFSKKTDQRRCVRFKKRSRFRSPCANVA